MREELRRIQRLNVCCRVMVSDRYGVWSAVTDDISARGCRIVTSRLLRRGTPVRMTISSDLFPEDLEAAGEVAWATGEELGVLFTGASRAGARSPAAWLKMVLEHGATPDSSTTFRVVPSVSRAPAVPLSIARAEARMAIGFVAPSASAVSASAVSVSAVSASAVSRPPAAANAVAPAQNTILMTARAPR